MHQEKVGKGAGKKEPKKWKKKPMPKNPIAALKIVNDWAKEMKAWGEQVYAFAHAPEGGNGHDPGAQATAGSGGPVTQGAGHIVGHPPDPPFE